ncbi:MAG: metal-dependent hydrolase [Deltaproteobacteria bacterium]|jgi:L-ascorbate metabolism protein UlaG (beta-lactamase superfamily)|nr:metal-dependent hydrolase [Deltaproteobacteria bacterium]
MSSITLTWHGHANFQLRHTAGKDHADVLVDPFFTGNPKAGLKPDDIKKPDIVLVTHTHGDHIGDAPSICKNTGALLGIPVGMAGFFTGIAESQILNGHGFNIGGSMTAKGVTVTMTQAFHTTDNIAPVGYIIRFSDGYTVYHAGDTGIFAGMGILGELYAIDLALLPAGGVYTMDTHQAAYAAKLLKAKAVVPMHWGTFPALAQNMEGFPAALAEHGASRAIVMRPGETVELAGK